MKCLAWIDGRVVEVSELPLGEPFVMQRIHTLNHAVYDAYAHVVVMRETTGELFGFQTLATGSDVERIVTKLLDIANAPLLWVLKLSVMLPHICHKPLRV